ncbi:MAG: TolB-like 6-bladed beta-propeller domain-containing protein [Rikenellaceae bacterium]|jgi:hypothetical protein|nr:TolB-like 6-bladed beta-propeller domain-containing protein [Rikenellaceae bacterium]
MKTKIAIVALLFVGLLCSCRNNGVYNSLLEPFPRVDDCPLNIVSAYSFDSIGNPDFIFSVGDNILLSEPQLPLLLSSYNMERDEYQRFLSKGNGSRELLDVIQIGSYTDSTFFVKSTFSNNVLIYANDTHDFLQEAPVVEGAVSVVWDNPILIASCTGSSRFVLRDTSDGRSIAFGNTDPIGDFSAEQVASIMQGLCVGNREEKRFAWASLYGDLFEIYDYSDTSRIRLVTRQQGELPRTEISEQGYPLTLPETKLGIVSITSNDQYIYALYNENRLVDALTQRDKIMFCNKILVYDWDGNPVKALQTDYPIRSIAWNDKHKTLFCVGVDREGMNFHLFSVKE